MTLLEFDTLLPDDYSELEIPADYADKTYGLLWQKGAIRNFVDGIGSIQQSAYKILGTEKGVYPIYSSDYGIAFDDLVGLNHDIVESELKRRVGHALMMDKRIYNVNNFVFTRDQNCLYVAFSLNAPEDTLAMEWGFKGL